ncbi:hypothetical protein NUW54_g955 [Trametes sanguinea]|uniref:Uncharacterized protein n=2 Tax=Trametes sanguinea TaxID=158606 RepID=A0ACC1Q9L1_9APHY|nr:hypothetical protein NUW54_g2462 [Trametes sanguinea]KAJ3015784.1 hypothetical protein NUW54_g955 [Trametes sanguinea]
MNTFWLYRVSTLVLVAAFSVVVIGLCAHTSTYLDEVIKTGAGAPDRSYHYAQLGLAVGTVTFVSSVLMLLSEICFEQMFTSYVMFEISWLSILWMFWVAVGSVTRDDDNYLYLGRYNCFDYSEVLPHIVRVGCSEVHIIEAFEFVTFGLLFFYVIALVVVAMRYRAKMHASPWTESPGFIIRGLRSGLLWSRDKKAYASITLYAAI